MQKKLIALAVAAAFSAPALAADVNVYGILDAAVASISGDGQKSDLIGVSGGLSTSRLGFTAGEDLDNGMKASIALEYALDSQNNTSVGSSATAARKKMLILSGNFGTVASGFLQTTGYDLAVKFDPTSGSQISPLQNVTRGGAAFLVGAATGAFRAQRALAYISPKVGDVTFAVNYATALAGLGDLTVASGAAAAKTSAFLLSANYDHGPLAAGVVYAGTSTPGGANDVKEIAVGGSYDFTVAKLFGTYQSATPTGASANKAYSLTAIAPVGPGAVIASLAGTKMAAANSNGSGLTLGYLYNMSKTLTGYAAYSSTSQDSGTRAYSVANNTLSPSPATGTPTSLTLGGGTSLFAVGLRKKF